MINTLVRKFAAVLTLAVAVVAVSASPRAISGVISDDMCKQKHMMPGHSSADCTRACVKSGSKYVLLSGDSLFVLSGDKKKIGAFAGQKVTVAGDVNGSTLEVKTISAAK